MSPLTTDQAIGGILSWTLNTLEPDYSPNKAGQAYVELYQQEWRTKLVLTPQTAAAATFRGFQGQYQVNIKKGQQTLGRFSFELEGDMSFECVRDIILGTLDCVQS